jgi:methylenetetrahydrofolate dehydrogenase (NADP+)/methenyltetrahydrofolate cyclohydrolase
MQLIDGRKLRESILEQLKVQVAALPFQPVFCDVLVGTDPASAQYVRMKAKTAESIGISFHHAEFPDSISSEELVAEIQKLNAVPYMSGLIVQLPLPKTIDRIAVLNAIAPEIDVDCLTQENSDRFYRGETVPVFPTARAVMATLDSLAISLTDKKIVVLGQGMLVGKPVTQLLRNRGIDPVTITRETKNPLELLAAADIVISATGAGKYVKGEMVKQGVIIVDAGTSESNGGIVGDVDLESVSDKASFVSPTPGGVGPVTVSMLLDNVVTVAESIAKKL